MDKYFEVEIGISHFILNILGLWPSSSRNISYFSRLRLTVALLVTTCFTVIPQTARLIRVSTKLDELLEILTCSDLPIFITLVRIANFLINRQALSELLDSMRTDWMVMKSQKEKLLMQKYAKISRNASIVLCWLFESTVITFFVINVYNRVIATKPFNEGKFNASNNNHWDRPLYMPSDFIYDVQMTPYYEVTWILQFFSSAFSAAAFMAIDAFFSALVIHLCGQLKILRDRLTDLLANTIQRRDNNYGLDLTEIVNRHKHLAWFANSIENIFNLQFLVQLVLSILLFILSGYQIISTITGETISLMDLSFAIYYYVAFATSLFIYCLIAAALSTECTKMSEAAYNSEWYELSPKDARLLILIMIRSQKPFELTAGKFVAFSMDLYCSVVKTSGGYLSMLLAIKQKTGNISD